MVDSSAWKRLGDDFAKKIIRQRRKIQSDKIVHFLQTFEEHDCTYFVLPLYSYSAFELTRVCPDIPARILLCVVKLSIEALMELHSEGAIHGKISMRNILIVEDLASRTSLSGSEPRFSIKLTNKTPFIINTLYHRLVTSAQDSFSPQGFGKPAYSAYSTPTADQTETDEEEMSSSDTTNTTGPLSLDLFRSNSSPGGPVSLAETVRKEEERLQSSNGSKDEKQSSNRWIRSAKISKGEDILAVLRMLARIRDMQLRRIKPPDRGFSRTSSSSVGVSVAEEQLDDWDDMLPFVSHIKVGPPKSDDDWMEEIEAMQKLPTLEELLSKTILSMQTDPEGELTRFLVKKKILDETLLSPRLLRVSASSSSASSSSSSSSLPTVATSATTLSSSISLVVAAPARDSSRPSAISRRSSGGSGLEGPPSPPTDLAFASGSQRERYLNKLQEASRRVVKMSAKKRSSITNRASSPRGGSKTLSTLIGNIMHSADERSSKRKGGLAGLFSSSPPPATLSTPTDGTEHLYNFDWLCATIAFFYNKTNHLWIGTRCDCDRMEAGKGKWMWRSQKTGIVATLPASQYVVYLMGAFYDSIHRMNLLQSKLTFDPSATSPQAMYHEFREHFRRLLRVFFHLAYNHQHVRGEEDSESDSEPGTPRSPQMSPRPVKMFERGSSGSRRQSKDGKMSTSFNGGLGSSAGSSNGSNSAVAVPMSSSSGSASYPTSPLPSSGSILRRSAPSELPMEVLWEFLLEFCVIFKVDIGEVEMMKRPLFE